MDNFSHYFDAHFSNSVDHRMKHKLVEKMLQKASEVDDDITKDLVQLEDLLLIQTEWQGKSDPTAITAFIFHAVLLTIVGVLGTVGNAALVIMFVKMKKQLTFHRLMIMLSACDTLLVILCFFIFALPHFSEEYEKSGFGYLAPIAFPCAEIASTASIYSTMAIAFERYLIICHPFYVVNYKWPAKRYIIFILVFSIIYNLPRFFSMATFACVNGTLQSISNLHQSGETSNSIVSNCTSEEVFVRPTSLRLNPYYYSVYLFWMDLCIMEVLPIIFLVVINVLILRSFRIRLQHRLRSKSIAVGLVNTSATLLQKRNISTGTPQRKTTLTLEHIELGLAKLSIVIVFIFIFCHSFKIIPNIYELIFGISQDGELESSWVRSVIHLSNFLIVLCCSSNFYVYCFTHLNIIRTLKDWSKNVSDYFIPSGQRHQEG